MVSAKVSLPPARAPHAHEEDLSMILRSHHLPLAVRIAALPCVLAFASCSQSRPAVDSSKSAGSVGIDLDAGPSVELDGVAYDISGNGFHRTGNIDVAHSTRLTAVIGGIPAGAGYTILLTAADVHNPGVTCAGSAVFDIASQAVTSATVHLQCRSASPFGSVLVSGVVNVCPQIAGITLAPAETTVGHAVAITGAASDADGVPGPLTYVWASSGGTLVQSGSSNATFTCTAAGRFTITLTAADGDCSNSAAATVDCSEASDAGPMNDGGSADGSNVRINEVESSGGDPGDWVELYNAGTAAADISGWVFRDNDDTHGYLLPAGTSIAPGAYFLLEEAAFGFGLGAADSARLYDSTGTTVVDSYTWTAHATTTYGRCPNGVGEFAATGSVTKGAPNDCALDSGAGPDSGSDAGSDGGVDSAPGDDAAGDSGSLAFEPWPGPDAVQTVDGLNVFGTNMSGLSYQPALAGSPAVLWAVQNGPSKLYRLVFDGSIWASTASDDWGLGKNLHYPDGTGNPDSEGVAQPDWAAPVVYVSTERNNDANTISRLSVLRFDATAAGAALTATHEWNLTSDLPIAGPNLGLEAVTFLPDAYLVGKGLLDESTGRAYQPANYPDHAGGLFLVGLEANGMLYAYALDHVGGGFHRVATVSSGQISIMDLAFDRDVGDVWAYCDNTCGNRATVLDVDSDPASSTFGRFEIKRAFDHPSTLPNANNEGITLVPESECVGGVKSFFWSDDDQTNGHAIRQGAVQCGSLF
jgi:hypothetical protein